MRALVFAAAAALAACVSAPPPPEPSYYVVRHLQKATGDDPELTEEGRLCAERLADMLADRGITAIFASRTRRAYDSAAPLGNRIGVIPTAYDPRDTPALVAAARAATGSVLIVGHSNTVPDIVEGLGGSRPGDLSEDRYGELWRVTRSTGETTVSRIQGC